MGGRARTSTAATAAASTVANCGCWMSFSRASIFLSALKLGLCNGALRIAEAVAPGGGPLRLPGRRGAAPLAPRAGRSAAVNLARGAHLRARVLDSRRLKPAARCRPPARHMTARASTARQWRTTPAGRASGGGPAAAPRPAGTGRLLPPAACLPWRCRGLSHAAQLPAQLAVDALVVPHVPPVRKHHRHDDEAHHRAGGRHRQRVGALRGGGG